MPVWRGLSLPPLPSEASHGGPVPSTPIGSWACGPGHVRHLLLAQDIANRAQTPLRPLATGSISQRHVTRSPSIISLTDSDSDSDKRGPVVSAMHRSGRSPSVISLTDSDSDSDNKGSIVPSTMRRIKRSRFIISNHEDNKASDHVAPLPPQPIIQWGSRSCVCSHGQSIEDPISVEDVHIWPRDFYVCDIAQFIRLTRLPGRQQTLRRMFEQYFGLPYPAQTFRETRRFWDLVQERRQWEFIDYGHTEKGIWSVLATEVTPAH